MTVTALVSGGKDSLYAAYLAESQGWPVDELLVLRPSDPDSFLFHTPNLALVALQAEAWGKRHREVTIAERGEAAEEAALAGALGAAAPVISAGAIASAYQWTRLVRATDRLRRRLFAPLWRKEPGRVVREEISAGLDVRIVQVAAEGLGPELLGQRLDAALLERFERLRERGPPVHVAGEGGEFETLVVDAPFFRGRIAIEQSEVVSRGGAHRLVVREARLVPKAPGAEG